jgi:hypothetical protein
MNSFRLPILATSAAALLLVVSPAALPAQSLAVSPSDFYAAEAPAAFSSSDAPDSSPAVPAESASFASAGAAAKDNAAAPSGSARPFSAVGVGVKIGLGGIGFDVATPLVKRLNIRGGAAFFNYTYTGTVDNLNISGTLKLNNAEAMVDFFPFNGSFRLSGGLTLYNDTSLSGSLSELPNTQFPVGNATYTSGPSGVTGTVFADFGGKAVPRFSLGWGNMVPRSGHIRFETEFGVEIIGTPTSGWSFVGGACPGKLSTCTTSTTGYESAIAASDVASQNSQLQSDLSSVKILPIFSFGLSYKIGKSH